LLWSWRGGGRGRFGGHRGIDLGQFQIEAFQHFVGDVERLVGPQGLLLDDDDIGAVFVRDFIDHVEQAGGAPCSSNR